MQTGETELRKTLRDILDRWESADQKVRQAAIVAQQDNHDEADAARRAAVAETWKLQAELGDLFLLLLHCCTADQADEWFLRQSLMRLLAPDIAEIVKLGLNEQRKGRHG